MRPRAGVALLVWALGFGCVFTSRPQLPSNEDARDSDAATGNFMGQDAAAAYDVAAPPTAAADGGADVLLRDASPCDLDAHDLDAHDSDAGDADAGDADAGDADDGALPRCDVERDGIAASVPGH